MKTREMMERSATYLAFGHNGRNGLDPETVEWSLYCIGNWKKWFVYYMKDKPNQQKNDGSLLGEDGAKKLADTIFLAYYDMEKCAFEEPTKGPYSEREPGGLEFGQMEFTDHEDAMNRDENRHHWKMVQVSKVNTPWVRKQENYGYLLKQLVRAGSMTKKNRVLINARVLVCNGAITWAQFNKLAATKQSL